ncbi:hypothetical protein CLOM_g3541 [Closterium sp. NIES-68]|nr:hypothetical protein CLOM_g3541 [Closterium sp. NIES-68]GJP61335.1 hypothetical protein CLOP_g18506 [Closterium sp. NIES-67]GJP69816.1 hypothetical protein CLOP_g829 [Closterium sp. NIES-67]
MDELTESSQPRIASDGDSSPIPYGCMIWWRASAKPAMARRPNAKTARRRATVSLDMDSEWGLSHESTQLESPPSLRRGRSSDYDAPRSCLLWPTTPRPPANRHVSFYALVRVREIPRREIPAATTTAAATEGPPAASATTGAADFASQESFPLPPAIDSNTGRSRRRDSPFIGTRRDMREPTWDYESVEHETDEARSLRRERLWSGSGEGVHCLAAGGD